MKYGICNLSVISVRENSTHQSEQLSQMLFGEYFKILEEVNLWSKIENSFDNQVGWVDSKQFTSISEDEYKRLDGGSDSIATDFIDFMHDDDDSMKPRLIGSTLPFYSEKYISIANKRYCYDGDIIKCGSSPNRNKIVDTSYLYLNAPFLLGGKTPLGIDCSGLTQMVYKINGVQIPRYANEQARIGEVLSFIEESEPGDLAFFDNDEGEITHVGIILENNYIIHTYGSVRVDMLDHTGIYNVDTGRHTHKLRVIKKIF